MFGGWTLTIAIGSLSGALASGLITYLVKHKHINHKLRLEGYGEAVSALYAWYEYPFQIRRRLSDSQETLDRLIQLGNENQQRIARSLAWMALDRKDAYVRYQKLVEKVKEATAEYIKEAWKLSPIRYSVDINLGSWGPETIDDIVKGFLDRISPTKLRYLQKLINKYVKGKKKGDVESNSTDSKIDNIKSSADKYVPWSYIHRISKFRSRINIIGFIVVFLFSAYIMISNRYIDLNSIEGQSALFSWGLTISLMSSHLLVFFSERYSRRFYYTDSIETRYDRYIKYGVYTTFLSYSIPLGFLLALRFLWMWLDLDRFFG